MAKFIIPTTPFISEASKRYPKVKWTGGSDKHASKVGMVVFNHPVGNLLLSQIVHKKLPEFLWRGLNDFFPMEWLLTERQFRDLMMVDLHRLAHGKKTSTPNKMMVNKTTGSIYHQISIDEPYVGGVRWWFEGLGNKGTGVMVRFRIERRKEATDEVRRRIGVLTESIKPEADEIYESLMEFNEPPHDEVATVRVLH